MAVSAASPSEAKTWRKVVFRCVAALLVLVTLAGLYPLFIPFGVTSDATTATYHPLLHRWHEGVQGVLFCVLLSVPLVGLVWKGIQQPLLAQYVVLSGLLIALVPLALQPSITLLLIFSLIIVVPLVLAYPTPRDLFRWPSQRVSIPLLLLGLVLLLVLDPDLWGNMRLQLSDAGSEHAVAGHWAASAVTDLVLVLAGLLSALKQPGGKVLGLTTGLTLLYLGSAALAVPGAPGSWGVGGGVLALGGGMAYLVVTLVEGRWTRQKQPIPLEQRAEVPA